MQNYQEMMRDTFDEMTQIGIGGGGTIFKAHHKRLDKDVVLKKIHTSQIKNISHRGELDLLKNLKHSYIPQVLDFIEFGSEVFTVMEYIPGQSFAQFLAKNGRCSQKDVAKWLRQLCEVVEYLHSQTPPIIHCDIKPANVMLTPAGDICLIDFNISGVKSEEGIATIGYSAGYAPVEQFAVVAGRLESSQRAQGQAGPSGGAARAEFLPGGGIKSGIESGMERTEFLPGSGAERTEILPQRGRDAMPSGPRTSQAVSAPQPAPSAGTSGQHTKSLMGHMSDAEWTAAKQVEAAMGKSLAIDERTDIYSMGCTLYHILTGVRPAPFYQAQVPVCNLIPNVSESLAYVIEKAMAVSPADRFRSSGEMLKVVRRMGTVDKRYKALSRRQFVTAVLTGALTAASAFAISLGQSTMEQERGVQYRMYVEAMAEGRSEKDYDKVSDNYQKATALLEEEQGVYYEMGMAYYEQRQYEQCLDFLSENVYSNSDIQTDSAFGRFDYIAGSCYFELEDYDASSAYFERAVGRQPEEVSYYRDYVVSLARSGEVDKAEQVLESVRAKGLSADILSLLDGEIALLRGEYEKCWRYLSNCVSGTTDDYIRLRAYTKLDDVCQAMYADAEQCDKRIEVLTEALAILPAEYQVTLIERLAQTYINYSDIAAEYRDYHCGKAIALFGQMEDMGYATFTSRINIAVLYDKMQKYEEAQGQLDAMLAIYPDNYILYKRKAFVELEVQGEKGNADRDYHAFADYYTKASDLYKETGKEDMEMLSLQQLYNDVLANGWL